MRKWMRMRRRFRLRVALDPDPVLLLRRRLRRRLLLISAAGSGRACQLPAGKTSILNSLAGGMIPVMPLLFSGKISADGFQAERPDLRSRKRHPPKRVPPALGRSMALPPPSNLLGSPAPLSSCRSSPSCRNFPGSPHRSRKRYFHL